MLLRLHNGNSMAMENCEFGVPNAYQSVIYFIPNIFFTVLFLDWGGGLTSYPISSSNVNSGELFIHGGEL